MLYFTFEDGYFRLFRCLCVYVLEREYFRGLGGNLDSTPPSRVLGRRGEVYKKDGNEKRSDDGGLFLRGGLCKSHPMSSNRVQLLRYEVGLPQLY